MTEDQLSGRSWLRAIGIGLGVAMLTALVAVILMKIGVSPFPKPPSLAFAETLLGRDLPLPIGLLFHTAYVTSWCVVFVLFFPQRNIKTAMALALQRAPEVLPDKNALIVVYCASATCKRAGLSAARLESLGYTRVHHYVGGKKDWVAGGFPLG